MIRASALKELGDTMVIEGRYAASLEYYEQALSLYRDWPDHAGEATTLNNVGLVWQTLGEPRKALGYYEQALSLFRELGDRRGEATTLNNIGGVWSDLGEKHRALEYYEQALSLRRVVGDRGGEATTLSNSGTVWSDLGEKHRALEYYEQALPLFRELGDRGGEATTLNNIGYIYFQNGELEKTVEIQQQIIEIVRVMGAVGDEALYLFNIANVYQKLGRIDEAEQSVLGARDILLRYKLPQDAGSGTVAEYDAFLARLRGEPPPPQTLPQEAIQQLLGNTFAVKTEMPEKLDEWRGELQRVRTDFATRGADWAIEVAFADALLALLDDQPASLPDDNPYAPHLQQLIAAIAKYHADQGSPDP